MKRSGKNRYPKLVMEEKEKLNAATKERKKGIGEKENPPNGRNIRK